MENYCGNLNTKSGEKMDLNTATDRDHRIIDAVSIALNGRIGGEDDVRRLREQIEDGSSEDKLNTACEIAVAFIRWAQDLKEQRDANNRLSKV